MKYAPIALSLLVAAACGGTDLEGGAPNGTGSGSSAGGGANATGGKTSIGGGTATGGSVTVSGGTSSASGGSVAVVGGSHSALGGQGANLGGAVASGGAPATSSGGQGSTPIGGATNGATSCDLRDIRCRAAQPVCEQGEVPSVVGTCYGPCVKIDTCGCASAEQCPEPNMYTCLVGPMHCSHYLALKIARP